MDITKIDPAIVLATIGIISMVISAWLGRKEKRATVLEKEAMSTVRLAESWSTLVTSWEQKLESVQQEMRSIKEENNDFKAQVVELGKNENILSARVKDLEELLQILKEDRNRIAEERDSLWSRVEELERKLLAAGLVKGLDIE